MWQTRRRHEGRADILVESASVAPHLLRDLRIADFGDVTTFDTALTQFAQAGYPVYDTLPRQRPRGELAPHLATSWSMPDPTT